MSAGVPLFLQVSCDATRNLVPSETGSECVCVAGYVDTSPPGGDGPATCQACPVGQYKAATDTACQVSLWQGAFRGVTSVRA